MSRCLFDPGMALAFLDDLAARLGPSRLPSMDLAWDAAWFVCVASDPRHETAARIAFASVVIELDQLSSIPLFDRTSGPAAQAQP